MVLLLIFPTKWRFHWGYTPFSDIPIQEKKVLTANLSFWALLSPLMLMAFTSKM
jgi:hypothetical protein